MQRPPLRKVATLAAGGCAAALLAARAVRRPLGRGDSDTALDDELMEETATGEGMPERDDQ
ncbi:MAG TPA: hypothetical protein VHX66_16990 [Solirubrobacteraceae bacterium]|nr:hypothetical protein [Solirubrobacteraceae bacterium]